METYVNVKDEQIYKKCKMVKNNKVKLIRAMKGGQHFGGIANQETVSDSI